MSHRTLSPQTRTRAAIAMLVFMMTNAVLFGAGLIVALLVSHANAEVWIPIVVVASFILAAPIAWEIAPRVRARNWPQTHYQPATLRVQERHLRR
jgi:heme/copper-type cytochrome/quinol oxidase subunit 3